MVMLSGITRADRAVCFLSGATQQSNSASGQISQLNSSQIKITIATGGAPLRPATDTYRVGQRVPLVITMTNTGSEPIYVCESGTLYQDRPQLLKDGKPVPYTSDRQSMIELAVKDKTCDKENLPQQVLLRPNEPAIVDWFNLAEGAASLYDDGWYGPLAAGKYNIWAQALGFETTKSSVDLSATKHQDLALRPMTDAEQRVRQLPGELLVAALPEATEDDARIQVELAEAALKETQGTYELAKTFLDWTIIRSPIDGVVLEKLVEPNELVVPQSFGGTRGPSTALIAVADPKDLQVEIDLSEADLSKVFMGQKCRVSPEAYSDKVYEGHVAEIAPEADRQKGTLQIKVQIHNPDQFLTPNLSAKVDFVRK